MGRRDDEGMEGIQRVFKESGVNRSGTIYLVSIKFSSQIFNAIILS